MYKSAIVAVCIATSFSWVMPAQAFPVTNAPLSDQATSVRSDIVKVDYNDHSGGHIYRPHGRYNHGYHGGYRGGYHGNRGYYGNRHYHHGGNVGAIIGGLAAGAIIGGALSARPHYGSHASYCASRYRTYRASDNTYQPTNGPRRQCR